MMTRDEMRAGLAAVVARLGPWRWHNIRLADDLYTIGADAARLELRLKRFLRIVSDTVAKPLSQLRVLDLACCEGLYAIEFARQGARVVGIEAREEHLAKVQFVKEALGLGDLKVIEGDVRDLSRERHGEFDVVLCAGIFYHLDAPDVFRFAHSIAQVCSRVAIFDTHVAAGPVESHEYNGTTYWGSEFIEHADDATQDQRQGNPLASLDNARSFWLTRPSLYNLLIDAGFASVMESHVPTTYDAEGRITIFALKGKPMPIYSIAPPLVDSHERWPEALPPPPAAMSDRPFPARIAAGLRRLLP